MKETSEPKSDVDSKVKIEPSLTPSESKSDYKDRLVESPQVDGGLRSTGENRTLIKQEAAGKREAHAEPSLSETIKASDNPQQVAVSLVERNREFLQSRCGDNSTFIFYTDGQKDAALDYAKSDGVRGVTLNMTPAGIELEKYSKEFEAKYGKEALDSTWRSLSMDFASKASGEVVWFGPRSNPLEMDREMKETKCDTKKGDSDLSPGREMKVLFAEEWDALRANPKVTDLYVRSIEDGNAKVSGFAKGVLYEH